MSFLRFLRFHRIVVASIFCLGADPAPAQTRTWRLPSGGGWGDPCGWSVPNPTCDPASVPDTVGEFADISLPGSYEVRLSQWAFPPIAGLSINNPLATLHISGAGNLTCTGPTFVNEGTILQGPYSFENLYPELRFTGDTTITGTGKIVGAPFGGIYTDGSAWLTNSAGHTIRGGMDIGAQLVNHGLILSGSPDVQGVFIEVKPLTNDGTIRADAGGDIQFRAVSVTNGGGLIHNTGGQVTLDSWNGQPTRITGGTLQADTPSVITSHGSKLDGPRILGTLLCSAGTTEVLGQGVINDGVIRVDANAGSSALTFSTDGLLGTGQIQLNSTSWNSVTLQSGPGVTLTVPATQTIYAYGVGGCYIDAAISNQGVIAGEQGSVHLSTNPETNNATLKAENGCLLYVSVPVMQNGTGVMTADGVAGGSASRLLVDQDGSITGGTIQTANGGVFQLNVGKLANLTINGTVQNTGGSFLDGPVIVNNGTIQNQNTLTCVGDVAMQGAGTLTMVGPALQTSVGKTLTNGAAHQITGFGTISANLVNQGTITATTWPYWVTLSGSPKTNNGVFKTTGNGRFDVAVNVGGTGSWIADAGSIYLKTTGVNVTTTGAMSLMNSGALILGNFSSDVVTLSASDLTVDSTADIHDYTGGTGTVITLSGNLDFNQTDETKWNLHSFTTLKMTGGSGGGCTASNWAKLEVGGLDQGGATGYGGNFNLGTLALDANAAVMLVDNRDNGNRGASGKEALYCWGLTLANGAKLHLNGKKLYVYGIGQITAGAYGGGQIVDVIDCNNNGVSDECDIAGGTSQDCNANGVPDSCDIANGPGSLLTFASGAVNLPIPDNNPAGVSHTLSVSQTWPVTDVNVNLSITHTYDSDLVVTLTHNNTTVTLINRRGGSGDNFTNTTLDDEASAAIGAGSAPFTGSYRPDQPLSAFDGMSMNGPWTLKVVDTANVDVGTLLNWSLAISKQPGSADANGDGVPDECVPTPPIPGDMNCDGVSNLSDVAPFVQALLDPAGYHTAYPTCSITRADMNGDGAVNGRDTQGFVNSLTQP